MLKLGPLFGKTFAGMDSSSILGDTGAILAVVSASDRWHGRCNEVFKHLRLPLLVPEAVLTELFHLIPKNRSQVDKAWKFLRSGAIKLACIETAELVRIQELMTKYSDRPMDFADATLVHLAERESLNTIFTVDHSDFQTYRINGTRRFHILPPTHP